MSGNALVAIYSSTPSYQKSIAWSPDDRLLALWGQDLPIQIFDSRTGHQVGSIISPGNNGYTVTWGPHNEIAVSSEGRITLWQ
jgi:WD40 repeat protein